MFNISQVVFVIGFPRSGTTWFSHLINSHPATVYRHEPFGRDYRSFGDELFSKLKFGHGLSDADHASVIKILMKAKARTEKPPFFRKQSQRVGNVTVQKLIWLAAKANPLFAPLYTLCFTPSPKKSVVLVIKETRSSVNLDSIIAGARADKLIILVRHPYGVIASHVSGNKAGVMSESSSDLRREWLKHHSHARYLKDNRITEDYVLEIPEAEFLAIGWRVQNEEYLRMHAAHRDSRIVLYDAFVNDVLRSTLELFRSIGLEPDEQVLQFVRDSSSSEFSTNVVLRDASSRYFSVFRGKGFDPNSWKKVLAPQQLDLIDNHTCPLVIKLGLDKWIESRQAHESRVGAQGHVNG